MVRSPRSSFDIVVCPVNTIKALSMDEKIICTARRRV